MERDYVDRFTEEWRAARPDLDAAAAGPILRVLRLAGLMEREMAALAARHGLKPGQFQVLAALRRLDPEPLTPSQLMATAILSSGAMTPIVDKLEAMKLVRRRDDPSDRRGVLVELTARGRQVIDRAVEERLARHLELLDGFGAGERKALSDGLRRLLLKIEGAPARRAAKKAR
jgi:DNA-binding MarR family transcriptional regulator